MAVAVEVPDAVEKEQRKEKLQQRGERREALARALAQALQPAEGLLGRIRRVVPCGARPRAGGQNEERLVGQSEIVDMGLARIVIKEGEAGEHLEHTQEM